MERIFFIMLMFFYLSSCTVSPQISHISDDNKLSFDKDDEGEWEIIVFDSDYTTFLATQPPKEFFTEQILKTKNIFYVTEWNSRFLQSSAYDPNIYEMRIEYNPDEKYGLDFEYKLYMFFKFVEKKYKVKI